MTDRLNGPQKAAILLLSLGEEAAAEVMKNLSKEEITLLSAHLSRVEAVTPREVDRVTNEFYRIAEKGKFLPASPETKTGYLKKILSKALGEDKTDDLIGGMLKEGSESPLEKLKWHDPRTIAEYISGEHPQVIAVILANLGDPNLTRQVMEAMPEEIRGGVLARLVRLREISSEWVEEIEASMIAEMAEAHGETKGGEAGPERVAGVINAVPRKMEENMMAHIEEQDQELAGRIRRQMFPFEDFIKLDNQGMQKVLEQATNEDLILALCSADEPIRRHFLRNLTDDNARALEEALESPGPIRISDMEAAQKRLSNIARILAAKGELHILERNKKK